MAWLNDMYKILCFYN